MVPDSACSDLLGVLGEIHDVMSLSQTSEVIGAVDPIIAGQNCDLYAQVEQGTWFLA